MNLLTDSANPMMSTAKRVLIAVLMLVFFPIGAVCALALLGKVVSFCHLWEKKAVSMQTAATQAALNHIYKPTQNIVAVAVAEKNPALLAKGEVVAKLKKIAKEDPNLKERIDALLLS